MTSDFALLFRFPKKNYVVVLENMKKAKRGSDATRSFRKNRKARKIDPAVKPTKTAASSYREQDAVISGLLGLRLFC